jgi:hypothetical protein
VAELLLAACVLIAALAGKSVLSPSAQAALHEVVKRRWEGLDEDITSQNDNPRQKMVCGGRTQAML